MRVVKVMVVVLATIALASCCNCKRGKSMSFESLTSTSWQLIQFEGEDLLAGTGSYTVAFGEESQLTGKGDCNRYFGTYSFGSDGKVEIKPSGSTRMMCPNQEREDRFLKKLSDITSYNVDKDVLMLFEGGVLRMSFERE